LHSIDLIKMEQETSKFTRKRITKWIMNVLDS